MDTTYSTNSTLQKGPWNRGVSKFWCVYALKGTGREKKKQEGSSLVSYHLLQVLKTAENV